MRVFVVLTILVVLALWAGNLILQPPDFRGPHLCNQAYTVAHLVLVDGIAGMNPFRPDLALKWSFALYDWVGSCEAFFDRNAVLKAIPEISLEE